MLELLNKKRKLRKKWQSNQYTRLKKRLNYTTGVLTSIITIERNSSLFLSGLDATSATDHSL